MKKPMLMAGMALCILALVLVVATSYYNGTAERVITADKAVILSLGGSETVDNIILSEGDTTVYSITAEVKKSSGLSETVNATLTIVCSDESEIKTLSNLDFAIYEKGGSTALQTLTGSGSVSVTGISATTEYELRIRLKDKADGSRYTAEELKNTGGKLVISFTTEGDSNA